MDSRATATWQGDLMSGKGTTSVGGGLFKDGPLSWKARTEGQAAHTTPEELLAAAHASCFSMAFSNQLAKAGHAPTRLDTSCVVTFGPKQGGGFEVKSSKLSVRGKVPGIDEGKFRQLAEDAKNGCPISSALKIAMSVEATLEK